MPRPFYHDRALYERELDRIWRRGWLLADHTCQVAQPGDYFTLDLDGDALLVVRDDSGTIGVFHNICTHRGTLLCAEQRGHARAFVCPYHQWTFSRRGELLRCVGMQEAARADAEAARADSEAARATTQATARIRAEEQADREATRADAEATCADAEAAAWIRAEQQALAAEAELSRLRAMLASQGE